MAIYHLSIKVIGRSHGRSAVSAAAYRAGERLCDYDTGTVHDYTHKVGVILSEIILPENAPESYRDRETLWNSVQKIEKNANAQLAREIEVALPNDIPRDWQIECVRNYINRTFVSAGMCADWALHDKGDGNPHAHILLTMRQIKPDGTWDVKKRNQYVLDENGNKIPVIDKKTGLQKVEKKTGRKVWERRTVEVNDWNDQGKAEEWREAWADHINFYLTREEQVDHRSFERQGIDKEPTIHEGYVARQMEQKGRIANRCQVNRDIRERNRIRDRIREKLREVTSTIIEKANSLGCSPGKEIHMNEIQDLETLLGIMDRQEELIRIIEDQEKDIDQLMEQTDSLKKQLKTSLGLNKTLKRQIDELTSLEQS